MDIFHPNNNNNNSSLLFDKRNMIVQSTTNNTAPSSACYTSPKNHCNIVDTIENIISSNTFNNNNNGIYTNKISSAFVRPFLSNYGYYYQQTTNDNIVEVIHDEDDHQKHESISYMQQQTTLSNINSYVETDASNRIQISTGENNNQQYFLYDNIVYKNGPLKSIKNNNNKSLRHVPHKNKPPQIVERRNARERRRVEAVNSAFIRLRKAVPIENTRGKRISKVKTLQKAIEYITALQNLLKETESYFPIQFKVSFHK
ncbi:putative uncharacterized protein DDB_G0282499 [Chrysoperla carnea]|uniref:putative uncharacterized protein DDB_G0282499 n=1 Tax=Chrysoperla carnea TaxID=189513 RepID=UPI001D089CA7|nr:putative uncharacterized protein DDB_G0282499 [Chrysoperla carnea]